MTDTDRLAALRKKAEGVGFDIYEVHADVYELRQCKSDNPVDTYDDWTLEFCLTERGLNLAETLLAATDPAEAE